MVSQQQIQKFDVIINNVKNDIDSITNQITSVVGAVDKLNEKKINNLDLLFNSRKVKINELKELLNSDIGKSYIESNKVVFQQWLKDLISHDEYFLELLGENVSQIGIKLRELIKKKSLLVYLKDK
jgi:hypothetical protein